MPAKTSKNKIEKTSQPKHKVTGAQIVFAIFAVLIILAMVLGAVSQTL